MNEEIELTPRQQRIIPYLLTHSIVDACRVTKISRTLVWKWMQEEAFQDELKRAKDELFNNSLGLVKGNVEKAVYKLVELMEGAEKQDVQVRCAENILEYAVKLKQMEDLEKRLTILEQAMGWR